MNILDMIMAAQNNPALGQMAKNFGLGESQTRDIISQVLPSLARGMQNNASQSGGLEDLLGALSGKSHQRYVDQPDILGDSSTVADGNSILGHIFGSKDVSRNVAGHAAAQTGFSSTLIKKMLPVIASVVMGSLSKNASGGGGLGDVLSGALSGGNSNPAMDMITSLIDSDNDGSIADDLLSMATKFI